jgi:hypothetical protein
MTIRSQQVLRRCLDSIMSGLSWRDAMAACGARSEGAGWQWKHNSKEAEQAGDETSIYFLDWPAGSEKQWFHILCDVARDRRGVLLATLKRTGDTCQIIDGKMAYQTDDFGQLVLDDLGVPVVERVAIVEPPTKGKHRENPDAVWERLHPRRELAPSSYSSNVPKMAPIPPPNALSDYLKATGKNDKQPMTPGRRYFLDQLADLKANGPKNKPSHPVEIFGRDRDPPERISTPSDQTGIPRTAEVSRDPAPRPAYVKPPRLDGARVPPPGGFRVR